MSHLSHHDYDALLAGLRELYACRSAETLPAVALAVCCRLIPGELAAYTEIDSVRNAWRAVCDTPNAAQALLDHEAAWLSHFHDHPVLKYYEVHDDPEVRTISDFTSLADWLRSPLYAEFFRRLGALDQLVVPAPKRNGLAIGVAIDRGRRSFSQRDRLVASLLREHLMIVHENVAVLGRLKEQLEQLEESCEKVGLAMLPITDRGRMIHCSEPVAALLRRHFDWSATSGGALPRTLGRWAREQIAILRRSEASLREPSPLVIGDVETSVLLKLLPDRNPGRFVIVIHAQRKTNPIEKLGRLGLTAREAEVLFWVAHGRTNSDVAATLNISARTVQKHMERVFAKLGVATRTQAAVRAMELLREP